MKTACKPVHPGHSGIPWWVILPVRREDSKDIIKMAILQVRRERGKDIIKMVIFAGKAGRW